MRRGLDALLPGRRIRYVRIYRDDLILGGATPKSFRGKVSGSTFGRVRRRAKHLLFSLSSDGESRKAGKSSSGKSGPSSFLMRAQVRMTGRFAVAAKRSEAADFRHPGIDFRLDNGQTLFYDDVRRLGGFDLFAPADWEKLASTLGPEPLGRGFAADGLARILSPLRAPVKNVLLDQRKIAGIGNIYACEALHRARIDPRRHACSLEPEEMRRLHRAIRDILRAALEGAGTTLRDFRSVSGSYGSFQNRLRVYQRAGDRCPSCAEATVSRVVQAGRSSFFCPGCQR